jgi:hypothetical protein
MKSGNPSSPNSSEPSLELEMTWSSHSQSINGPRPRHFSQARNQKILIFPGRRRRAFNTTLVFQAGNDQGPLSNGLLTSRRTPTLFQQIPLGRHFAASLHGLGNSNDTFFTMATALGGFKAIAPVPSASDFIDIALSSTQRKVRW